MTPKLKYQEDIENNGFSSDASQQLAVEKLNDLHHQFQKYINTPIESVSMWQKWIGKKPQLPEPPNGLYFWGGVGRGKTYLMDVFFDTLPTEKKLRVHFHRFMFRVHEELKALGDISDPLEKVADVFKAEADIICFDEFFVSDITDAMILGKLIQSLFTRNVVLVATSNIPPNDLYRNGLQRARFLPAISLIQQHCDVLNVDSGIDYRLRTLEQAEIYHFPLDDEATVNLNRYYRQLVGDGHQGATKIEVNHRTIDVINAYDDVLMATFSQLCESMRSQNDYIEMSREYHSVLLANVKQMGRANDDSARRFIALVDEFYERNVKLIISSEVPLEELYTEGHLNFEFKRCQSRLIEMQSLDYLMKEHLP